MRNLIILGTFGLSASAGAFISAPLEMQGVMINSSMADLQRGHKTAHCDAVQCSIQPTGSETDLMFGPASPNIYTFKYMDDRLGEAKVIVKSKDFRSVLATLIDKYGRPSAVHKMPLPNTTGDSISNTVAEWRQPDGTITAVEHFDLDTGGVVMAANWYKAAQVKEGAAAAKDAASAP